MERRLTRDRLRYLKSEAEKYSREAPLTIQFSELIKDGIIKDLRDMFNEGREQPILDWIPISIFGMDIKMDKNLHPNQVAFITPTGKRIEFLLMEL